MIGHEQREDETVVARPSGLLPRVLLIAVLGAVVLAALSAYGDVRELRGHLASYDWRFFGLALAATLGNYALRFYRWVFYLRSLGVTVPVGENLIIFLSGFAASVTPGKVGEVFKSFLLYERRGVPVMRTAPIVVAERLTDLMALVSLTAFGALVFPGGWAVALGGAAVVVVVLVASAWRPLGELFLRTVDRIPAVRRLGPRLRVAYGSLWELSRPKPLLAATALATVAWTCEVFALHIVLLGFQPPVHLDAPSLAFAYSAPTIAGAVALLPGGLGVTEAGMTALLQTLGGDAIPLSVAAASTILVRLATFGFAVALGALALGVAKLRPPSPPA